MCGGTRLWLWQRHVQRKTYKNRIKFIEASVLLVCGLKLNNGEWQHKRVREQMRIGSILLYAKCTIEFSGRFVLFGIISIFVSCSLHCTLLRFDRNLHESMLLICQWHGGGHNHIFASGFMCKQALGALVFHRFSAYWDTQKVSRRRFDSPDGKKFQLFFPLGDRSALLSYWVELNTLN